MKPIYVTETPGTFRLSFEYNPTLIDTIKRVPSRPRWDSTEREWVITKDSPTYPAGRDARWYVESFAHWAVLKHFCSYVARRNEAHDITYEIPPMKEFVGEHYMLLSPYAYQLEGVRYALDNRLEIRDYEIQIEEQKLGIKQQKVQGRVRGSIDAYVRKMGVSNPNTDFNMGSSLKESYENFINFNDSYRPNYGVGFTVTVPILDWGENRALVRAAEARLKQTELARSNQLQYIETEVRNLVEQLNNSLRRLQLLEKNVTVAEKSFAITLQRYSDGDIDSQALALERNRLNNAYLSHLSAYTTYQLTLADLMRKTFYDFEHEQIIE